MLSIKLQSFSQTFLWWILVYYYVDSRNPLWIWGLLLETNSLVSVPSKEHCMFFLQASTTSAGIRALTYATSVGIKALTYATSVGIRALTCSGLIANWQDGNHHSNDGSNDIDNIVLTWVEFLEFCERARDENHQFFFFFKELVNYRWNQAKNCYSCYWEIISQQQWSIYSKMHS